MPGDEQSYLERIKALSEKKLFYRCFNDKIYDLPIRYWAAMRVLADEEIFHYWLSHLLEFLDSVVNSDSDFHPETRRPLVIPIC